MADDQSPTMATETVYTCKDRDGRYRYVGRTKLPLQKRARAAALPATAGVPELSRRPVLGIQ